MKQIQGMARRKPESTVTFDMRMEGKTKQEIRIQG